MKFSSLGRIYTKKPLLEKQILYFDEENLHYLKNVLRLQPGNKIRIFNERYGEYEAIIQEFGKKDLSLLLNKRLGVLP